MKTKINSIIKDVLNEREIETKVEINEKSKLRDDLGLDSFGLALLTVHIENEFEVDVFEDGIVTTVGEIYEIVSRSNDNW